MPITQQPIHSLDGVFGIGLLGKKSTKPRQSEPTSAE